MRYASSKTHSSNTIQLVNAEPFEKSHVSKGSWWDTISGNKCDPKVECGYYVDVNGAPIPYSEVSVLSSSLLDNLPLISGLLLLMQ